MDGWRSLLQDLFCASQNLANSAAGKSCSDIQVASLAILARSAGHIRAITLLVENLCIVEARTILRGLFESLFWIVLLQEQGVAAITALKADEYASRTRRGKKITQNDKIFSELQREQISKYLQTFQTHFPKAKIANPSEIAELTSVRNSYLLYQQLSSDSAHLSANSLDRHLPIHKTTGDIEFSLEALSDFGGATETIALSCMTAIGIITAFSNIFELNSNTKEIDQFNGRYDTLLRGLKK